MRTLAVLALAALLVGGIAFAASQTAPGHPAHDGSAPAAAEVLPDALLDRAREEVRAYGASWDLVTLGAVESAEPAPHDKPYPLDPRPGNGLAPAWWFHFTGPDGQAFVLLKGGGSKAAIGWAEQGHFDEAKPLPAWRITSADAVAKARHNADVAAFLDDTRGLAMRTDLHVHEDGHPWWTFHAYREHVAEAQPASDAPASSPPPGRSPGWLGFRVQAMSGDLVVEDPPVVDPPYPHPPSHPCCGPQEHTMVHYTWIDPLHPKATVAVESGGIPGADSRFILTFEDSNLLAPKEITLRILGEDFQPLAEATGKAPLRLDVKGLPGGLLYAEVSAPGPLPSSAQIQITQVLTIHPGVGLPYWEQRQSAWGYADPFTSTGPVLVYVPQPATEVRANLLGQSYPADAATFRLRLLDANLQELGSAEGASPLHVATAAVPAGELWVEVELLGPAEGAPPAVLSANWQVDLVLRHDAHAGWA